MNRSFFIILILVVISCSQTDYQTKLPSGSDLIKFDSAIWQKESSMEPDDKMISEREKMLKDLIQRVLPGKNKSEIEHLLSVGSDLHNLQF